MEPNRKECEELLQSLFGYIDEELPDDACATLQDHLAGCAPCGEFVESMRRSLALVRQYRVDAKPGPLPASAKQELRRLYQQALGHGGSQQP
jgi:anti-sigma factor RsiW